MKRLISLLSICFVLILPAQSWAPVSSLYPTWNSYVDGWLVPFYTSDSIAIGGTGPSAPARIDTTGKFWSSNSAVYDSAGKFGFFDSVTGTWVSFDSAGGVTDHGALTGLNDDDHDQYWLTTEAGTHAAAATVHQVPVWTTSGSSIFYTAGSVGNSSSHITTLFVTTIQNAATQDIIFNGSPGPSPVLIPSTHHFGDLGKSATAWGNIYVRDVYVDDLQAKTSNIILRSQLQTSTGGKFRSTADFEFNENGFDPKILWDFVSGQDAAIYVIGGQLGYIDTAGSWASFDSLAGGSTNAFQNWAYGSTTVVADSPTDTITFIAGSGISYIFSPGGDQVTISSTGGGGWIGTATSALNMAGYGITNIGFLNMNAESLSDFTGTGMLISSGRLTADHDAALNFLTGEHFLESTITIANRSDYSSTEHLDWNADQGATNIHSGNVPLAATASALAANSTNCAAGEIPLGVAADGGVEGCYEPTEADITDLTHFAGTFAALSDSIALVQLLDSMTLDTEWDSLAELPINLGTGLSASGDTINWAASFADLADSVAVGQLPDANALDSELHSPVTSLPFTSITGTALVNQGGTGKTSWTQYAIPYASAATTLSEIPIGSDGKYLKSVSATAYTWDTPGGSGDMTKAVYDADADDDIDLAAGGTNASLTDPGANRLWGWDDIDNDIRFFIIGSGLAYNTTTDTLTASGGSGLWTDNTTYIMPTDGTDDLGATGDRIPNAYADTVDATNYVGITDAHMPDDHALDTTTNPIVTNAQPKYSFADSTTGDDDYEMVIDGDDWVVRQYQGDTVWADRLRIDGLLGLILYNNAGTAKFTINGAGSVTQGSWGGTVISGTYIDESTMDAALLGGTIGSDQLAADVARDSELFGGNFSDLAGSAQDSQIVAAIARDSELFGGNFSDLAGSITDAQLISIENISNGGTTAGQVLATDGAGDTYWKDDATGSGGIWTDLTTYIEPANVRDLGASGDRMRAAYLGTADVTALVVGVNDISIAGTDPTINFETNSWRIRETNNWLYFEDMSGGADTPLTRMSISSSDIEGVTIYTQSTVASATTPSFKLVDSEAGDDDWYIAADADDLRFWQAINDSGATERLRIDGADSRLWLNQTAAIHNSAGQFGYADSGQSWASFDSLAGGSGLWTDNTTYIMPTDGTDDLGATGDRIPNAYADTLDATYANIGSGAVATTLTVGNLVISDTAPTLYLDDTDSDDWRITTGNTTFQLWQQVDGTSWRIRYNITNNLYHFWQDSLGNNTMTLWEAGDLSLDIAKAKFILNNASIFGSASQVGYADSGQAWVSFDSLGDLVDHTLDSTSHTDIALITESNGLGLVYSNTTSNWEGLDIATQAELDALTHDGFSDYVTAEHLTPGAGLAQNGTVVDIDANILADSHSAQWFTPVATDDNQVIFRATGAGTISEVECYTTGGTNTIINVYKNALDVSNGNFTCGAGAWASDTALTNTAFVDDDVIQVDTISISGTPSKVFVQVNFDE